ncbi:MAG: hypothetical protein V1798_08500 [Pseudomonadota bacterium]
MKWLILLFCLVSFLLPSGKAEGGATVLSDPPSIYEKIVHTSCYKKMFSDPHLKAAQLAGIPISKIVVRSIYAEPQEGFGYGLGFSRTIFHEDLTVVTPTYTHTFQDCQTGTDWE